MTPRAVEKPISIAKSHRQTDISDCPLPDPFLCIVGKNSLQNTLLKLFLEEHIKTTCSIQAETGWTPDRDSLSYIPDLILFDCFGYSPSDIWIKLGFNGILDPAVFAIALFNASKTEDEDFEKQAIEKRFRGIFYCNEPPERLPKGIEKMLQGELWYSRKATSAILMESQRYKTSAQLAEVMLTPREKEILVAIASGAGNSDIASEFFISLHTVKSHVYNIYKKIDVRNRLEATLWVARYL